MSSCGGHCLIVTFNEMKILDKNFSVGKRRKHILS